MKIPRAQAAKSIQYESIIGQVAGSVIFTGIKKATKYISPKCVIKATFQGRRDSRNNHSTVIVTVGAPNYAERAFIKLAKKAGEPFPILKTQIKPER